MKLPFIFAFLVFAVSVIIAFTVNFKESSVGTVPSSIKTPTTSTPRKAATSTHGDQPLELDFSVFDKDVSEVSKLTPINFKTYKLIAVSAEEFVTYSNIFFQLQKRLKKYFSMHMTIVKNLPAENQPAIILGRTLAEASGAVSKDEVDKLKFDGYFMKGSGNRIYLGGYGTQGTIYAVSEFLKYAGIKAYPWLNSTTRVLEIHKKKDITSLPAFSVFSKPYFEFRSARSSFGGHWGESIYAYSVGDFDFINKPKNNYK